MKQLLFTNNVQHKTIFVLGRFKNRKEYKIKATQVSTLHWGEIVKKKRKLFDFFQLLKYILYDYFKFI